MFVEPREASELVRFMAAQAGSEIRKQKHRERVAEIVFRLYYKVGPSGFVSARKLARHLGRDCERAGNLSLTDPQCKNGRVVCTVERKGKSIGQIAGTIGIYKHVVDTACGRT